MKKTMLAAAAALAALFCVSTWAAEAEVDVSPPAAQRYLVTSTHAPGQCMAALDDMAKNKKTFSKTQWGCKSGDHTAYLITEASDSEAALKMLPASARQNAKVVELTKVTPKQLKAMHAKADKAAAAGK